MQVSQLAGSRRGSREKVRARSLQGLGAAFGNALRDPVVGTHPARGWQLGGSCKLWGPGCGLKMVRLLRLTTRPNPQRVDRCILLGGPQPSLHADRDTQ